MRCEKCNYLLWNLASRSCPECGEPFRPSSYSFAPNSVQFCCPHCGQAYYGTDDEGRLEPPQFDCVSCLANVHMDQMVLRPAEGLDEEQTRPPASPWERRKEKGWIRAWFAMAGMALFRPTRLMQVTSFKGTTGLAWNFATSTQLIIVTIMLLVPLLLFRAIFSPTVTLSVSRTLLGMIAVGMYSAVAVLLLLLLMCLWGAVTHALLSLTGHTAGGIDRTYRAICFSSGANVISLLPCIGIFGGTIWWLFSAVFMVKAAQRVGGLRAAFATLAPPLSAVVIVLLLVGWGMSSSISSARVAAPGNSIKSIAGALGRCAGGNSGAYPDHAIELAELGYVAGTDFVCATSGTDPAHVPVGGTTLAQFKLLPSAQQVAAAQAAAKSLPPETVAHRLGDFVFTYHGFDANTSKRQLWLVVYWPEWVPQNTSSGERVWVAMADGTTLSFPQKEMIARLKRQNDLRARAGLPPLPHPAQVTHKQPALVPATQPAQ